MSDGGVTRINESGQPIGAEVPHWISRPAVEPELLIGSHVTWTYYPYPDLSALAAFEGYLASLLALPLAWPMAILSPDGAGLGVACYLRENAASGSVEIGGIVLTDAFQRTTGATEAICLMSAHAFDDLGYRRLEWKCDSLNAGSRRAARRLGFVEEGTFRNAMVYRGRNRDTTWFSITDAEWPAVSAALTGWLAPGNFDGAGTQRRTLESFRA